MTNKLYTFVLVNIVGTINVHLTIWIHGNAYFSNVRIYFPSLKSKNKINIENKLVLSCYKNDVMVTSKGKEISLAQRNDSKEIQLQ